MCLCFILPLFIYLLYYCNHKIFSSETVKTVFLCGYIFCQSQECCDLLFGFQESVKKGLLSSETLLLMKCDKKTHSLERCYLEIKTPCKEVLMSRVCFFPVFHYFIFRLSQLCKRKHFSHGLWMRSFYPPTQPATYRGTFPRRVHCQRSPLHKEQERCVNDTKIWNIFLVQRVLEYQGKEIFSMFITNQCKI